ncbi:MAG: four helix bundle protein [Candidatus Roizmanbacteria bacterium]|nr:four helix bundle protein [Candidatus Roizmanbacteria bacterium]
MYYEIIYQKSKIKMQNDKSKFKYEFKERLYRFVLVLIKYLGTIPYDTTSKILINQLVRSSTSILANYTEGQSASSRKDFIKYFEISLKSANESKVWIELLRDTGKFPQVNASSQLQELIEISNIFASSILTLKGKK